MQDGIFLPYENMLNYDSFAVRISEDEIPNLIKILRVIISFSLSGNKIFETVDDAVALLFLVGI